MGAGGGGRSSEAILYPLEHKGRWGKGGGQGHCVLASCLWSRNNRTPCPSLEGTPAGIKSNTWCVNTQDRFQEPASEQHCCLSREARRRWGWRKKAHHSSERGKMCKCHTSAKRRILRWNLLLQTWSRERQNSESTLCFHCHSLPLPGKAPRTCQNVLGFLTDGHSSSFEILTNTGKKGASPFGVTF